HARHTKYLVPLALIRVSDAPAGQNIYRRKKQVKKTVRVESFFRAKPIFRTPASHSYRVPISFSGI
ncbi:MAG TPA: hypothetical protein DCR40_10810, partial [Prolixibacteraceae bacterium]|nr:hypothetical protein [Prolixibacteraceae bacterium]